MSIHNLILSHKQSNQKWIIRFFGIPVYTKKYDDTHKYYSILGIRILKKANTNQKQAPLSKVVLDKNQCNIAISLFGGLGDQLINANFIYLLRKKLNSSNVRIDIYEPSSLSKTIFKEHDYVDYIYSNQEVEHNKYDLSINLSRFPILRNVNKRRILFLCPQLYDMVQIWEKNNVEKYKFIDKNPQLDGMLNKYYLIHGYKRWSQFDVEHALGMTEDFPIPMFINVSENNYLKNNKIPKKFITIHRGVDVRTNACSVKQWPVSYYNKLIELIREKYPNIFIIQLGDSKERCPEFTGTNLNLSGETSLEELKVLLKHSSLHIDGEGGMVHLRHALHGGKSVVLFGPTDPNVYGYSENTNLVGKGCPGGCEWINENWQNECTFGIPEPICQFSLKPEIVFNHIDDLLSKITRKAAK